MAKFSALFSGSKGNCVYLAFHDCEILVDAGVSFSRIKRALSEIGTDIKNISAVFVTHEHSDHINGLKMLTKNCDIPVFASKQTAETLVKIQALDEKTVPTAIDGDFKFGEITVHRFATSHDCEGSSGYSFTFGNKKISVCTDLGFVSDEVKNSLLGSDLLMIESNHDSLMLKNGPYPPVLKLRISSDKGHLSNTQCAEILPEMYKSGTKRFVLAHLSENNNTPLTAKSTATAVLMNENAEENKDYILYTASSDGRRVEYI